MMSVDLLLPGIAAAIVLTTWWCARLLIRHAVPLRLLDEPLDSTRSAHQRPTPSSGGIAFITTFLMAVGVLCGLRQLDPTWLVWLLPTCMITVLGAFDDRLDLSPRLRLAIQVVSAILLLALLGPGRPLPLPGFEIAGMVLLPLELLVIVWVTNLFNFMDGADGLAASETGFVAAAALLIILLHSPAPTDLTTILTLLLASMLGFLAVNRPPARLFMGNVGSSFLGMLLVTLWLASRRTEPAGPGFWCWLILVALFAMDATWTLLRRAMRGADLTKAHREHAYQYRADAGGSGYLLIEVHAWNWLWLLPLAVLADALEDFGLLVTMVAYLPVLRWCLHHQAGTRRQRSAVDTASSATTKENRNADGRSG